MLLLAGCAPPFGLLYSNMTVPYSTKFTETPTGTKRCVINNHQVKEPVTGYNIYAEWSWDYIVKEAEKAWLRLLLVDAHGNIGGYCTNADATLKVMATDDASTRIIPCEHVT